MYTFKVSNVEENKTPLVANDTVSSLFKDLEQCSNPEKKIYKPYVAGFAGLVYKSFAEHYPLEFGPDDVWITLLLQMSNHINKDPEKHRGVFVDFQGKKDIIIRRDHFRMGSQNDWEGCFSEFSDKIGEYIGDKKDIIVSNFSSTTNMQRSMSELALMESMKAYFRYGVTTLCGIPSVKLLGKVDDWVNLKEKAKIFELLDVSKFWYDKLTVVLDQFIDTAKGNPNIEFWQSFCKEGGGSGGPFINGHVLSLYLYDREGHPIHREGGYRCSVSTNRIPDLKAAVPFSWSYYGKLFPMKFAGSIAGFVQEEDRIKLDYEWAIIHDNINVRDVPLGHLRKGVKFKNTSTSRCYELVDVEEERGRVYWTFLDDAGNKLEVNSESELLDNLFLVKDE